MAKRTLKGVENFDSFVTTIKGVTAKTCIGKPDWYRGKKMLKFQTNGTRNHVCVQVCETEGKQSVHIYSTDIGTVIEHAKSYATREGYITRG